MAGTYDGTVWIVETKGRKELDLPQKLAWLKQYGADATAAEEHGRVTISSSSTKPVLKSTSRTISPRWLRVSAMTKDAHEQHRPQS